MKIFNIIFIFLFYNVLCYSNTGELPDRLISPNRIVNLYKNDANSVKVLTGVAVVRFKDNNIIKKNNNLQNIDNNYIYNTNDYKIVSAFLSPANAVSSQKERMEKMSSKQVNKIKQLEEKLFRTMIVEFDSSTNVLHFCNYIKNKYDNIELAEPYYVSNLLMQPNDPRIDEQDMLKTIEIFDAWELSEGDEELLIGISDCGVNWEHVDLKSGIAINEDEIPNDGIDNDNNGYVDDYYGYNFTWKYDAVDNDDVFSLGTHGTEVAGILAARVNNGIGIAGVANKCRIIPLKVSTKSNYNDIIYGYQSMIYAAVRGCKVLNCSWGIPSVYSVTNQLIVDYATACGLAIVAAGGNVGSNSAGNYSSFYPAGYFGVLGVGAVNADDCANNTVYGVPVRIEAPSNGNMTLSGTDSYKRVTSGSSFSSPVVSGVVALLRAYKPELTSLEAIELVRQSGDIINNNGRNDFDSAFIPLRVNAYKALNNIDLQKPSVVLVDNWFTDINTGEIRNRVNDVDTLFLNLVLENILGDVEDITLNMVQLFSMDEEAFKFIDNNLYVGNIKKGERILFKTKVIVNNPYNEEAIFKAYITGIYKSNQLYEDAFKFRMITTNKVTTFRNENMIISAGDAGSIGYSTPTGLESFGDGFTHKKIGNFIYEGGFIAVSDETEKAVSVNLDKNIRDRNSFKTYKKLNGDDYNINIIRDDIALEPNRIGIEVTTEYILPNDSSTALKMLIDVKNLNETALSNLSIGQYYDWDVGKSNARNLAEYCQECIPAFLDKNNAAVEIAYDDDSTAWVGSLVYYPKHETTVPDYFVLPQAAGIDNAKISIFEKAEQVKALTYGNTLQTNKVTDISYLIGLYFLDDIKPKESAKCVICTAVEDTKEKLINSLEKCANKDYGKNNVSIKDVNGSLYNDIVLMQNNKNLYINLNNYSNLNYEIFNSLGTRILANKILGNEVNIDMSIYDADLYFVRLYNENISFVKTFFFIK